MKRYVTTWGKRRYAKHRRAQARASGRCINENAAGTHGPATHGCRCERCHDTHRGAR